jgi:hypothetical protein
MPTEAICIVCNNQFDSNKLTFDQRLIGDKEFCVRCWSDIMNSTIDELEIELPNI